MRLDSLPPLPRLKAPAGLQGELLPFQERGLGWMVAQERSEHKGGILADEMGLGKTIQTIALLLQAKQQSQPEPSGRGKKAAAAAKQQPRRSGPTLVVAPTSALLQWSEEIRAFAGDRLSVLVYYNAKERGTPVSELMGYDVVLTTYPVAEIEWREQENKTKVRCKYCSRLFLADKLRDHNKYWCGPAAERTAKQRKTDKKSDTQSINLGVTRTKIFLGLELRCF